MKYKSLIIVAYLSGIIPFFGGLVIFFTWWANRAWYAKDSSAFELAGLLWIYGSFCLAITGLILASKFLKNNTKKNKHLAIGAICVILVNIPAVYVVGSAQSDIAESTYLKFVNQSYANQLCLKLVGGGEEMPIGTLDNGQNAVIHFKVKYISGKNTSWPVMADYFLVSTHQYKIDTVRLPIVMAGQCLTLTLNHHFKFDGFR